jgi:phosphate-selective porin OprO/OprP
MRLRSTWNCGILLLGAGMLAAAPAVADQDIAGVQEPRVVDQLLDILRQNKLISEQQYQELKRKAEAERQEDLRKARAAPPSPAPPIAAAPPLAAPTPSPDTLRAYFKNGFNLETADGNFKLAIGALTQVDTNVSDPGSAVKQAFELTGTSTGVEFRRARLYIAGLVYNNIDYKFEYDFAENSSGQPAFKDVYMGMSKIPVVQYVRVGHFKEPFSLEEITPDTYTTFQERSTMNAFDQPDRNTGVAVMPTFFDKRVTFAAGGFRLTDNFGNGSGTSSPYDITARLTGLPTYEAGQNLIHLGFSYSHKFRHDSNDPLDFSSRPEAHLFPVNLVDTGKMNNNGADLLDPEVALVRGPFSIQGEYTWALVQLLNHSNPTLEGGYVEASYFLTGESRASFYNKSIGAFDRVIPLNNFSIDGKGSGAWQLAARFSRLDLRSASINGGALDDVTGGVNWYLNPVTKITANYVWSHLESVGDSNIVESRFQLAF